MSQINIFCTARKVERKMSVFTRSTAGRAFGPCMTSDLPCGKQTDKSHLTLTIIVQKTLSKASSTKLASLFLIFN